MSRNEIQGADIRGKFTRERMDTSLHQEREAEAGTLRSPERAEDTTREPKSNHDDQRDNVDSTASPEPARDKHISVDTPSEGQSAGGGEHGGGGGGDDFADKSYDNLVASRLLGQMLSPVRAVIAWSCDDIIETRVSTRITCSAYFQTSTLTLSTNA